MTWLAGPGNTGIISSHPGIYPIETDGLSGYLQGGKSSITKQPCMLYCAQKRWLGWYTPEPEEINDGP
jgi:hypothetical protein